MHVAATMAAAQGATKRGAEAGQRHSGWHSLGSEGNEGDK